ncbi:hypothetical protein CTEN210_18587 [Chaetoceros tenuissimus]|uniref:Uncharacterized protein n=1 Tax=Chaetoceros tenuissimus TaxID=426638 RepID=A0AAD3DD46_9STRA|nr:hypothetical protein CTEN210_18587 [Chaetoceros tenuissimus]
MFKSVVLAALVASAAAFAPASSVVRTSALAAEWEPSDGSKWVEKDFETEMTKLEKEAEERLDAKIKELEANIESVGKP